MTEHGGNIYRFSEEKAIPKKLVLDFSASINPLGLPMSVISKINKIDSSLYHYPDPDTKKLKESISAFYNINSDSIISGNGSTELIYLCARALKPRTVLIPTPTFSEYERACLTAGASIKYLKLQKENNFDLDHEEFILSMKGCDIAFVCNPNNPTGRFVSIDDLLKIADAARDYKCRLILDEAFIDFLPESSIIGEVANNPYLIVLRSMTKFYALSALRLGFGVFHPFIIDIILQSKEPWTVNSLAQIAGITALGDEEYKKETFRIIGDGKSLMEEGFKELSIEYIPSSVNYYLLKIKNAQEIISNLHKAYIMVRNCSNFRGLDSSYIRVAVKSPEDNIRLLEEVSKLCGQ